MVREDSFRTWATRPLHEDKLNTHHQVPILCFKGVTKLTHTSALLKVPSSRFRVKFMMGLINIIKKNIHLNQNFRVVVA